MPLEKKYAVTAGAIRAGLNIHTSDPISMNPFEVAHQITSFLEAEEIEYFIGGSLASTTYGEPRFTQDVNLIVRHIIWGWPPRHGPSNQRTPQGLPGARLLVGTVRKS